MENDVLFEHPWQQNPAELIRYAIEHIKGKNAEPDFDNRMAFLLLDIGVESLFKIYLSLPDEVINTTVPYIERCSAIKGGFHKLVQYVKKCADDDLKSINMNHVLYYHKLRNKLYHESDSITISRKVTIKYAKLSIEILHSLLNCPNCIKNWNYVWKF